MPIVEPAPWRRKFFEHIDCPADVFIPTDDPEAWAWNPRHRWVFDKLQIALSQGLVAAPHGLPPPAYPVFSKPIINFAGMGAGGRVLSSLHDYQQYNTPGHFWMPLAKGRHVSSDAAVVRGRFRWIRHATGLPTTDGMFDYWTVHAKQDSKLERRLARWTRRFLSDYTGMVNFETIGETIIEAHLRFADQWPDLYGKGWVEALVGLYRDKRWRFAEPRRREGYSLALFGPHGRQFRQPPPELIAQLEDLPGVSSVQITFYEHKLASEHSMPPGGFRVALVNAWDLEAGMAARARLGDWFFPKSRAGRNAQLAGRQRSKLARLPETL